MIAGVMVVPSSFFRAVNSTRHLVSSRQNAGTSNSRASASLVQVKDGLPVRSLSG